MKLGFGQFVWSRNPRHGMAWEVPGAANVIDLRPIPAQSRRGGGPEGWAIVKGDTLPAGVEEIGDPTGRLDQKIKDMWLAKLGFTPSGDTIADAVFDTLTDNSHPDGLLGPRPMLPTASGMLSLSGIVAPRRFAIRLNAAGTAAIDAHSSRVLDVLRENLRPLVIDRLEGRDKTEFERKITGGYEIKYGQDAKLFYPADLREEAKPSRTPETSYRDKLNQAASDTMGDGNWTETVGDFDQVSGDYCEAQTVGSQNLARYEQVVSTDDMYGFVNVANVLATSAGTGQYPGVILRYHASATTFYVFTFAADTVRYLAIDKQSGGTPTAISNDAATGSAWSGSTGTIECRVDGSSLAIYNRANGRMWAADDVTHAGYVRGGLRNNSGATAAKTRFTEFVVGDILLMQAVRGRPRLRYHGA